MIWWISISAVTFGYLDHNLASATWKCGSCFVLDVQAPACGDLNSIWPMFKHGFLNTVADHVHTFMTRCTHLHMSVSSRMIHHVTNLSSSQTGVFEHDNEFPVLKQLSTVSRSRSSRSPLGCGGTRDLYHGSCSQKIFEKCVMLLCH